MPRPRQAVLAALLLSFAVAHADPLKVKTETGKLQGTLTTDGKVAAFKGIPYAAPPVGDLRWRPPMPAAKWKGTHTAATFGSHCFQTGTYNDMVFHDPGPSEDCLTLNVWAPKGAKRGSLPVMVWIYGGGFATGGTSENRQDGQFLAHRNVVVVSMNYRLGIWGFMVHPELTAESPQHASGNYGLMDIAAAIQWTKRNIAAFGGDPANLTLFGESAGSFAVSAEIASPLAKDAIAKAIGESGAAFYSNSLAFPTRVDRETKDSAFAQTAFGTSGLADLRKLSNDDLLKAVTAKTTPPPQRFSPDVDGIFLPRSVPDIYNDGAQAHIPLLAGWNKDEGGRSSDATVATFTAQAEKEFADRSEDFLTVYPAATDTEAQTSAGDYARDKFIAFSTWRWIESHVETGTKPVFRYRFDLGTPGDRNHPASSGAFHSDEIEYVFGTLDSRPDFKIRPEDRALSEQMGQYWTNFARTGDPNAPNLPKWPTYGPEQWQLLHLNTAPEAVPDTERARYIFLDDVWGK